MQPESLTANDGDNAKISYQILEKKILAKFSVVLYRLRFYSFP